jgi:4-hydroxy-tetrahydrodipicolinate synthase
MTVLPPGAYTALVTPFTPDGTAVDWQAYERLVEAQLEARVTGLVPAGTTGESPCLTDGEQRELVSRAARLAKGRATVVAGIGTNNTKKTIEAGKAALEAGAEGVMVVMPYYNKPSQDGLLAHVRAIAEAVSCPVMLYNIPGRTTVELTIDTLLRIIDVCPNVVALKDATGGVTYVQELLLRATRSILVLAGDDALTLPLMSVGARGVVSVTSNLYPRAVSEVVEDALAGRYLEAQAKNKKLFPVHRALFVEPNPQPIKAALALKGRVNASVRPPLVEASPACTTMLAEVLRAYEAG